MEPEEGSHQHAYNAVHHECQHYENGVAQFIVIFGDKFVVESPDNCLVEVVGHKDGCYVANDKYVYQEKQEVLPVPEPNTVINPGTVVVHVKNAPIAC